MLGTLTPDEIEFFLKAQLVGRIGCHASDLTYVVPISYAYDGTHIYCHTTEGRKMEMMRKNPNVCFQVDELKDMANWRSVIVQGRFEELHTEAEIQHAMTALFNRSLPVVSSVTTHLGKYWPFHPERHADVGGIFFRITPTDKTGRFENGSHSPKMNG